ncbi:MAG: class I SAM-dependent methyltransferase [Candidatus Ranarchaeia archaeon]
MIPYLHRYVRQTGKIVAVDYSQEMIAVAKEKYVHKEYPNVEFWVRDINDMYLNRRFNAILCYSCFPHFVDKQRTLQHLMTGLRYGGF